ncbi:MAG: DNA replication and repair protein RecF [Candidatus Goldbacteria bacterium]|nr:DNA replication and repair protein RecF [Candidatus Goldiibacteriota bacterium]
MYIKNLELNNFRNYDYLQINFDKNINLFYGNNSSGKTNIIEAIYFMSTGKSFRCNSDDYLIKEGSKFFNILIEQENDDFINNLFFSEFNKENKKKIFKINNKNIKKLSEIIGKIPLVLFSPEDIYMIKGEPLLRRKYIDNILLHTDQEYFGFLSKFYNILKNRNYILKLIKEKKIDKKEIETWNVQLKDYSIKIINKRIILLSKINDIINKKFSNFNNITLKYKIKNIEEISKMDLNIYYNYFFEKYFEEEIIRSITLIGPHRDDIEINYYDKSIKYFGSEGQQRLICIILKLAEGIYIKEKVNVYPIVLLDDFTSELDDMNKNFISEMFNSFQQIIITTTNIENVKNIKINKYFFVENGRIKIINHY